jgi:LuxR family maltose regulon positive regulatory protein
VIDYLTEEVLARQSAAVRDFLLQTAVLDRFTGALCDALTGGSSAASMLAELERRDLFLVPLDNDRAWYRYHPLFADVLRAKLGAEQPELVRVLHRRASDWFAAGDRTEDAVRHALAAEDFDRAAYLMECAVPELRRTRQDGVLRKWAGALPGSVVRQSPVLSILSCANHLFSGDLEGAESRLDDADAALAAGSQDLALSARWADTEDQRTAPATVSIFRASLAQARGDVAGTTAHARRALALAGPADHLVRGAGAGFLGLALWAAGDLHEALTTFGEAVRSLRTGGNVVDALDATIVLADLQVAVGRPSRARRLYERGLESMATDSNPYVRAAADLHVGLAELDREANELDSAKVHLEAAQVLAEQGSITENGHRWFVAMAQLCAARGDFGEALSLLDQAEASYRHGFYPDVRPIAAIRARIRIAQGDLDSATDWAQDRGLQVGGALDYLHEYEHLTLVRLLLAQPSDPAQTGSPVALAGILLERLEEMAMPSREGSLVEIRMLQALAQQARGELTKALTALTRALDGAPEPGNVVRLYLDEGPPMLGLVHRAAQDGHPMARALLKRAHAPSEGTPSLPAAATQFSQREREVLHLLAGELTGPQIARELYVTVNTLRTHTKHIYTKLDATTRASAVRRARERGLI